MGSLAHGGLDTELGSPLAVYPARAACDVEKINQVRADVSAGSVFSLCLERAHQRSRARLAAGPLAHTVTRALGSVVRSLPPCLLIKSSKTLNSL